jgi:hypothetical protein
MCNDCSLHNYTPLMVRKGERLIATFAAAAKSGAVLNTATAFGDFILEVVGSTAFGYVITHQALAAGPKHSIRLRRCITRCALHGYIWNVAQLTDTYTSGNSSVFCCQATTDGK